jgi:hypothetical protein
MVKVEDLTALNDPKSLRTFSILICAMIYSGKWLTMINITVPIKVTMNEYVNSQSINGCINITTPSAINMEASISQEPRRKRSNPSKKSLICELLQM